MSQWFPESNPFTKLNRQSVVRVSGNAILDIIEEWLKQNSTLEDVDIRFVALYSLGLRPEDGEPTNCTTTVMSDKIAASIYEFDEVDERSIRLLSMHISDAFGLGTTLVLVWK